MKCPFCQLNELKVTDSRDAPELNAIKRRRECQQCQRRFTTFETVELSVQVHKRDGSYEDFQKQKLINGLNYACQHTTISHEQVIQIAEKITMDLMEKQIREISTSEIGEIIMNKLHHMDPIAYIRFACVYRRFTDINELMDAIQTVKNENSTQPKKNRPKVKKHSHLNSQLV